MKTKTAPVSRPKTYEEKLKEFAILCKNLAERAWLRYFENGLQPLYLVGTQGTPAGFNSPIWMSFDITEEASEGQSYVNPEHFPRDKTCEQLISWIRDRLKREPMYIYVD